MISFIKLCLNKKIVLMFRMWKICFEFNWILWQFWGKTYEKFFLFFFFMTFYGSVDRHWRDFSNESFGTRKCNTRCRNSRRVGPLWGIRRTTASSLTPRCWPTISSFRYRTVRSLVCAPNRVFVARPQELCPALRPNSVSSPLGPDLHYVWLHGSLPYA